MSYGRGDCLLYVIIIGGSLHIEQKTVSLSIDISTCYITVEIANEFPIFAGLLRDSCKSNACKINAFSFTNTRTFREVLDINQLLIRPAIIYACQRRDILANNFTTERSAWILRTSGVQDTTCLFDL